MNTIDYLLHEYRRIQRECHDEAAELLMDGPRYRQALAHLESSSLLFTFSNCESVKNAIDDGLDILSAVKKLVEESRKEMRG